jgi:hypothetical protein
MSVGSGASVLRQFSRNGTIAEAIKMHNCPAPAQKIALDSSMVMVGLE